MAFNPDAFIAKNKSFNPDAFIAKNKPQPKVETIPTKQEAVTLPPPQRSVMSAVTNPKVQVQEPETELTDFEAIEDKITTNGYEDLTPDEQIIYLENRPQLPNVQPDYPDEVNNAVKSTVQPTLKETPGVSKPMPNPMLPMGGGSFAVQPKQEQVMTDEQPQIGAYDPTFKQKIADWFRGDGLPDNADRIEKIHYGIGKVMRPLVKFAIGKTLKVPDVGWALIKKVAGDTIPEEVQSMNLEQAMDWAAGYNPSGFEKAVGSLAEFTGGISTAKQMLPTSQAKTVLDKAGQAALEFGTASAGKELSKGIAGAIDPKADYEYGGSAAITEEALLGAAFSLAGSGLKGLWGKLKPTEQSQALKILGLKNGASEDEIRKAAQQLALKYHPDKVRGMEDKFKSVMQARDEALKKTTNKDIIYPKQKPKMLTGEQNIGVSTDVAQNPVKPIPPDKVFGQGLGIGENLPAQSTPAVQTPEVKGNGVGTGNDAVQGNVEGSGANVDASQNIVPNLVDMAKKSENVDISSKPATISPVQENEVARDNIAPQDTTEAGKGKETEVEGIEFPLNEDGTVTVYHRTNQTADQIKKTGWKTNEPGRIYVGNKPDGQISGYGENVVELRVKPEDLSIDDEFPDGEAHFVIKPQIANKALSSFNRPAPESGGQKALTQEVKEKTEIQDIPDSPAQADKKEPKQVDEPQNNEVSPPEGGKADTERVIKDLEVTTSARQAEIETTRELVGLDKLPSKQRKGWQQSLINAKDKKISEKALRIATEVNTKPRALNDEETAGLVIKAAKLKNEYKGLLREISDTQDKADIKLKSAEAERVEQEFESITRALHASGSEKGRALVSQKLTIDQDYDLISVKTRAKATKGKELTVSQNKNFETLTTKLDEANARIDKLQTEIMEIKANKMIRESTVKRYKQMSLAQKDMELSDLVSRTKSLLEAGC